MSSNSHAHDSSTYYVPHSSPWPIVGSIALFCVMWGAVSFLNEWSTAWSFLPGALGLAVLFFGWFATVINENQAGLFNAQVDKSFRMGMMWFIISEVMFFGAFWKSNIFVEHPEEVAANVPGFPDIYGGVPLISNGIQRVCADLLPEDEHARNQFVLTCCLHH